MYTDWLSMDYKNKDYLTMPTIGVDLVDPIHKA